MNILYIADVRFPIERANGVQTMQTCHALAARGHEVTLTVRPDTAIPPRNPFEYYDLDRIDRLAIAPVSVGGSATARRFWFLRAAVNQALRAPAGSILLTRDLGVASAVLRIPRAMRPSVVYESHAFSPEFAGSLGTMLADGVAASSAKQRRLESRERRVWRRADGYITLTQHLAAFLRDRYGERGLLAAIPDGVRVPSSRRFEAAPLRPHPVVGYAGHLYPWKGVDILIDALALTPNVEGLIIGGHPAEPDLARVKALAAERGLERMTFTGQVDPPRVAALLQRATLLALPNLATHVSAISTSPLKLFEYMAAGKPIVASRLGALEEILREGENAVLVEPNSPAALSEGIRRILADPSFAARIARAAFDDATQYTWERRAERIEGLLTNLS